MALLSQKELLELLKNKPPLVEGMINPGLQVQPNGIELTLRRIEVFAEAGQVALDNSERRIPISRPLVFDSEGWINLAKGCYKIVFNEVVNIPRNIAAIALPRSSLLRCGATIETAVWDAGYRGRSESLLLVYNEAGFRVKRNARVLQLLFFKLSSEVEGYSGAYQEENIDGGTSSHCAAGSGRSYPGEPDQS